MVFWTCSLVSVDINATRSTGGKGRVWCVGEGGYEIQRGTYGVSLMIMMTNEYHEIMHVAYMHAHVHVL